MPSEDRLGEVDLEPRCQPRPAPSAAWVNVWLPISWPSRRASRTMSGWRAAWLPTTKNVAGTPCRAAPSSDPRRPARVGPVVERQGDPLARRAAAASAGRRRGAASRGRLPSSGAAAVGLTAGSAVAPMVWVVNPSKASRTHTTPRQRRAAASGPAGSTAGNAALSAVAGCPPDRARRSGRIPAGAGSRHAPAAGSASGAGRGHRASRSRLGLARWSALLPGRAGGRAWSASWCGRRRLAAGKRAGASGSRGGRKRASGTVAARLGGVRRRALSRRTAPGRSRRLRLCSPPRRAGREGRHGSGRLRRSRPRRHAGTRVPRDLHALGQRRGRGVTSTEISDDRESRERLQPEPAEHQHEQP